jgi:MoxR-like ATPase
MTNTNTEKQDPDPKGHDHTERAGDDELPNTEDVSATVGEIVENVERVIVGHREEIKHILTALLGRGHVLLEDVPGVGKTMLARAVAQSFDGEFTRVQFTPDLLPSDVTGVNVYNERTESFEFRAGPVFGNVVLGDEINRAPPKTQSALLEAMEETQVTVDGETRALPDPFTVIATQNTVEGDRAYDLPLAEVDRFMKKLELGYPTPEDEVEMLDRVVGDHPIEELRPVATLEELRDARRVAANVNAASPIREYATRLATYTREHAQIGVSPRGSISLLRAAQARAVLDGRSYVVPEDIQYEAPTVLGHRIRTGSGDGGALVSEALATVAIE